MQTVYIGNTLVNDVMLGAQRMDDVIQPVSPFTVEYLVIGPGGGGGPRGTTYNSGGGGAGGLLSGSLTILPYQNYYIQAGNFDVNSVSSPSYITGSNFYNVATGGGIGGRGGGSDATRNGGDGGSGGGAARNINGSGTAGTGISGQGFNGGSVVSNNPGGGGGAGSIGGTSTGGSGKTSSITGTAITYSTGGNGNDPGVNGSQYGDGGGGGRASGGNPGTGIQGVVILRYRGPQKFTGGTITTDGDFIIHTFTTSANGGATQYTQYTIVYQ